MGSSPEDVTLHYEPETPRTQAGRGLWDHLENYEGCGHSPDILAIEAEAVAEKDSQLEALRREAEAWAQEARTQRAAVLECYQAVTGATGEPADWHGAEPVRQALEALRKENERLRRALDGIARPIGVGLYLADPSDHEGVERWMVSRARAALESPTAVPTQPGCVKCGHEMSDHGEMGCTVPTGNYVYDTVCPCAVRPEQDR